MEQKKATAQVFELKDLPTDKKIGQLLLEAKVITAEQLAEAIALQKKMNSEGARKFKVGEVLLFQKVVSLPQLHEALRKQKNKADLSRISVVDAKKKQQEVTQARLRLSQAKKKEASSAWTILMGLIRGKKD